MHNYLLRIEPAFLKQLKVAAAQAGISMKSFIMEAILEKIARSK